MSGGTVVGVIFARATQSPVAADDEVAGGLPEAGPAAWSLWRSPHAAMRRTRANEKRRTADMTSEATEWFDLRNPFHREVVSTV